jgi:outer membrane protein OmpA-like peptidoglycan-associated protein
MKRLFLSLTIALISFEMIAQEQPSADSLIYAEGKIYNATTKEPIEANLTYQSLPYGNKVGVINKATAYSFPMFGGEKYSITVEATGFAPVKYMLDPADANAERKVIKHIELSTGTTTSTDPRHAVGHVMRLDNLIFQVGKAKVSPDSYGELDLLVDMMRQNPKMVIQLEGHTDYQGDPKENMKLSQMRVDAVKSYLVSKSIKKDRVKIKAFGGTQPLSRDNTAEAHRMNRRVEVRILQN